MSPKSVIVLNIDGLGAGFVGPYGNTWIDTPGLNRLAAESVLIEYPIIDTPRLELLYRSYCHGAHAMVKPDVEARPHVCEQFRRARVPTILLTDDPELMDQEVARSFDRSIGVTPDLPVKSVDRIDQTHFSRLMATAVDCLTEMGGPVFLWIHAQAMNGHWDAPLSLRRQFADLDDPIAPNIVEPPNRRLRPDYDPDELLGFQHAYSGEVVAVDTTLDMFLDALRASHVDQKALLVLTAPRGYPLGEHLLVGHSVDELYSELLHVPLIIRFPDRTGAGVRSQSLWQPHLLYDTLLCWLELELPNADPIQAMVQTELTDLVQVACTTLGRQAALRTRHWFMRCQDTAELNELLLGRDSSEIREQLNGVELFLKPDDRWDVNNVADRRQDLTGSLARKLLEFQQCVDANGLEKLSPLPRILTDRPE